MKTKNCIPLLILFLFLISQNSFGQGITSASINGQVTDSHDEPLIGAHVLVTHLPTGTTYGNATNENGYYRLSNMRVGGPYVLRISYTGYETFEQKNIHLKLGQSLRISPDLKEAVFELASAEVIAKYGIFDSNRTGSETNVSSEQLATGQTLLRDMSDFIRLTPQANIHECNGPQIFIAGMNNRYNAIYIDGAVNNDVFGLADSGTNGGEAAVSPISLDAIKDLQVAVAPYDVRLGGFAGGSINAVTRSGANKVSGSIYSFYRDQDFAGKTPTDDPEDEQLKLDDFITQTTGFRVGGSIIKNKLFYFINGERQREETPQPFDLNNYLGDSKQEDLEGLVTKLKNEYNYDPGPYTNKLTFLNNDKLTVKLDYNINQKHQLSLRHGYVQADRLTNFPSIPWEIVFENRGDRFTSTTHSSALEWNALLGSSVSNNLKVGYTRVRDDHDPYQGRDINPAGGNPNYFPAVDIADGAGHIFLGSEPFLTANKLDQDVWSFTDNLEIYKGKHTLTIGTHNEFYNIRHLLIPFNYGFYYYESLDKFINDELPDDFFRIISSRDDVTGDGSAAGVPFHSGQIGLYLQDEYQANDDVKITFALRGDLPFYGDTPSNRHFNNVTLPLISERWDLRGAETGQFIRPQVMWSPRLGFNWDVKGQKKTQIRGGIGLFTSRAPLSWAGSSYNNNGLNQSFIDNESQQSFNPNWDGQTRLDLDPNNPRPSGHVNLFAEDFKLPQFLKMNVVLDQKLFGGIVGTVDLLFNKTIHNIAFQNVNQRGPVDNLTGSPDNRPYYISYDVIDPTYEFIMLGFNTSKGYTYHATASFTKPFKNGLSGTFAYSYGDAHTVFDGTFSDNNAQWEDLHSIRGRNIDQPLRRSNFSQGSRAIASLAYRMHWNKGKNASTTFSFFHESLEGRPYSYIYYDYGELNHEAYIGRNLIYIPAVADEINLIDIYGIDEAGNEFIAISKEEQWTNLDAFIRSDDYLEANRGEYAERNASRAPWHHVMDFKVMQDFTIRTKRRSHQLQVSLDISNFTNLINPKWGRYNLIPPNVELIHFEGFEEDNLSPLFTYLGPESRKDISFIEDHGFQSSRWQMQLGLRYSFE